MAIATLEDLQGSIEVVVFPRLYETDRARPGATARSCSWPAGSTTAARRSRCWPTSSSTGTMQSRAARRRSPPRSPPAIAGRAGADRAAGPGGPGSNGNGNGHGPAGSRPMVPVGPGAPNRTPVGVAGGPRPLRPRCRSCHRFARRLPAAAVPPTPLPPIAPAEPIPTYQESGVTSAGEPDDHEEPALPDEARAREAALGDGVDVTDRCRQWPGPEGSVPRRAGRPPA